MANAIRASMNATIENIEKITEPYKVIAPDMICVCSCCFPGNDIFRLFPDMAAAGVKVSHSICPGHKRRYLEGRPAGNRN